MAYAATNGYRGLGWFGLGSVPTGRGLVARRRVARGLAGNPRPSETESRPDVVAAVQAAFRDAGYPQVGCYEQEDYNPFSPTGKFYNRLCRVGEGVNRTSADYIFAYPDVSGGMAAGVRLAAAAVGAEDPARPINWTAAGTPGAYTPPPAPTQADIDAAAAASAALQRERAAAAERELAARNAAVAASNKAAADRLALEQSAANQAAADRRAADQLAADRLAADQAAANKAAADKTAAPDLTLSLPSFSLSSLPSWWPWAAAGGVGLLLFSRR